MRPFFILEHLVRVCRLRSNTAKMRCSVRTDNLAQRAIALDLDEGMYTFCPLLFFEIERSILLPGTLTLAAVSIVAECTNAVPVEFIPTLLVQACLGRETKLKGRGANGRNALMGSCRFSVGFLKARASLRWHLYDEVLRQMKGSLFYLFSALLPPTGRSTPLWRYM